MKWEKTYPSNYLYDGRIKYTCGEFSIMKTNFKNMFSGKAMSEQYWEIYKDGEKIDFGFTLKEAKQIAEKMM